jgi:hypothetical protein
VEIRGLRGGGLISKVGRDGCDGDIDGEGGGEGGSGRFEAQGDVGGPAEWVLWDEVGRFHECVQFAVNETSDGACGWLRGWCVGCCGWSCAGFFC